MSSGFWFVVRYFYGGLGEWGASFLSFSLWFCFFLCFEFSPCMRVSYVSLARQSVEPLECNGCDAGVGSNSRAPEVYISISASEYTSSCYTHGSDSYFILILFTH